MILFPNFISMNILFKEKLPPLRVPRASNFNKLKKLFLTIDGYKNIDQIFLSTALFKSKSHFAEYYKLLILLDWIIKFESKFLISNKGSEIKAKLSQVSELNDSDLEIFKNEFLKLFSVKTFLKNIFNYDLSNELPDNAFCLKKGEIEMLYNNYRGLSTSVVERESRVIYNWLTTLNIIESLNIYDKNYREVCYHLTINKLSKMRFPSTLRNIYFKILEDYKIRTEWIDIPVLRNKMCIENFISKQNFNDLLINYIQTNSNEIQISTGSYIRKEVENEGLNIKNKTYFYLKFTN